MSKSLIELLDAGNKGDYCYDLKTAKGFNDKEILKYYEDELGRKLRETSNTQWDVALTIANFVRSGAWSAFSDETTKLCDKFNEENLFLSARQNPYYPIGGMWYGTNSIYLLTFLKEKFGLCRTTVYNYLEVVDEFATYIEEKEKEPYYSINIEAKDYQFWQLVEMHSLTYQERLKIEPNWTREQIRAYKKELREKKNPAKIQPAELVEADASPKTEAQQRFAKYSKDDLINLIVELEESSNATEQQIESLRERVLELENKAAAPNPFAADSRTETKREISSVIEKLIKEFDYEVVLCGRKQGAKAFAGNIAERILDRYIGEKGSKKSSHKSASGSKVKLEQISLTV